jgi:glutamine synthetase
MNIKEISTIITEQDIRAVEIGFADINGALRGKIVPARHFLKIAETGTAIARAPLAWGIGCEVFSDIKFASFENGFPDLNIKPVLSTFGVIPWAPHTALILGDTTDPQGAPFPQSSREVLKSVLKKAYALGIQVKVGSEIEFYLLDEKREPLYNSVQCYSVGKAEELEYVLADIRNGLETYGIPIEATHVEYGPAQVEIIPEYSEALRNADSALVIKEAVKRIARKHGLYATFMAKPYATESGSGYHLHQSLWDVSGTVNLFEKDPHLFEYYLAGLARFASAFLVLGSPTINSFKRFRENSFVPLDNSLGVDDRNVAFRSLLGLGTASRVENRTGSADANPYLITAASIASGIYGIENKLEASSMVRQSFPKTLQQAIAALSDDHVARSLIGEEFVDIFLKLRHHETELFDGAITDWEKNRYLTTV